MALGLSYTTGKAGTWIRGEPESGGSLAVASAAWHKPIKEIQLSTTGTLVPSPIPW